jgi:hypothetical protein
MVKLGNNAQNQTSEAGSSQNLQKNKIATQLFD